MTASTAREITMSAKRLDNDVNGNPRYYVPFYMLPEMTDKVRRAAAIGTYRGKRYGRGYVFQSYSLESDVQFALDTISKHSAI